MDTPCRSETSLENPILGPAPTACGEKDGWKTSSSATSQKYANSTNQVQPACVVGSALGIRKASANDKTAANKGLQHKIHGTNGNYGPVTGPFRVTVIYGDATASAAGQCSEVTFTADDGAWGSGGTKVSCKN